MADPSNNDYDRDDWGRESAGESERDIHIRVHLFIPSRRVWRVVAHWHHVDRNFVCENHLFQFEPWEGELSEPIEWKCPTLKSPDPITFDPVEIEPFSVLETKGLDDRELHDGDPEDYEIAVSLGDFHGFYKLEGVKVAGEKVTDDKIPAIPPHDDPSPGYYADIPEETDELTCSVCPVLMYYLQTAWNFRYVPPHLIGPNFLTEWDDHTDEWLSTWTLERRLAYRAKRLKTLLRPLLPFDNDTLDLILVFVPAPKPNRIRIHKFVW